MAYPVDEARIRAAEDRLGRRLPAALRERLLRDNGGELEAAGEVWQLHPVWDDSNQRTARKTASHLLRETEAARQWAGFPAQAIAIAENDSGDRLVLLPGDDSPKVWAHETGEVHAAKWS